MEEEVHRRCIAAIFALLPSSSLYPSRFVSVATTRQARAFSRSLPLFHSAGWLSFIPLSLRPVLLLIARFIRDPAGRISTSKGSPLFLRHDESCAHVNAAETSRRDARSVCSTARTRARPAQTSRSQLSFIFSDGLVVIEQRVRARFFIVSRLDVFRLSSPFFVRNRRFGWHEIQPFRLDLFPTLSRVCLFLF